MCQAREHVPEPSIVHFLNPSNSLPFHATFYVYLRVLLLVNP